MARKTPDTLRSRRWLGVDDLTAGLKIFECVELPQ